MARIRQALANSARRASGRRSLQAGRIVFGKKIERRRPCRNSPSFPLRLTFHDPQTKVMCAASNVLRKDPERFRRQQEIAAMVEFEQDDALDALPVGRDGYESAPALGFSSSTHVVRPRLSPIQISSSSNSERQAGGASFSSATTMSWPPSASLFRSATVVVTGVVLPEETDAVLARVDRLFDVRQQRVGRVEAAMQAIAARRKPQFALVQELMRYGYDQCSAHAQFREAKTEKLPGLGQELQQVMKQNRTQFIVQPVQPRLAPRPPRES